MLSVGQDLFLVDAPRKPPETNPHLWPHQSSETLSSLFPDTEQGFYFKNTIDHIFQPAAKLRRILRIKMLYTDQHTMHETFKGGIGTDIQHQ